jgi:aminoglycoside phosphotransferase (APT) family kinase protein
MPTTTADEVEQLVGRWLRENLGDVVSLRRTARWRPVWIAEIEGDEGPRSVLIRGERIDTPLVFPLKHEMTWQRLLGERGIPVAGVLGWIEELPAYVMEVLPGRPDFGDATDQERASVVTEYMGQLAQIHRLDVEEFAAAGIVRAASGDRPDSVGMATFEHVYRATKARPDPFLEFMLAWLRRNPLPPHDRESVIVWDSGQFHHERGRITGLLDVEIGHIGDPMMDLAAFRMRDTVLHFGDFDEMYAAYVAAGGFPLDLAAIEHHHIAFTLTNQLAFHTALAAPVLGSNYMTNLQWCVETNRHAVEALAEFLDLGLPAVEIPRPRASSAAIAHAHQVGALRSVETEDEFLSYELRAAFRLARHLQRVDEIGAQIEAADLDDLAGLLGYRPASQSDGDAALEAFVLADNGAHDHALIQLFHVRFSRQHATLGPAGSAMTTHHLVQPFRRRS